MNNAPATLLGSQEGLAKYGSFVIFYVLRSTPEYKKEQHTVVANQNLLGNASGVLSVTWFTLTCAWVMVDNVTR